MQILAKLTANPSKWIWKVSLRCSAVFLSNLQLQPTACWACAHTCLELNQIIIMIHYSFWYILNIYNNLNWSCKSVSVSLSGFDTPLISLSLDLHITLDQLDCSIITTLLAWRQQWLIQWYDWLFKQMIYNGNDSIVKSMSWRTIKPVMTMMPVSAVLVYPKYEKKKRDRFVK